MENKIAALAAHGYSRKFWRELKDKFSYRDRLMALTAAVAGAAIARLVFDVQTFKIAAWSAVGGASVAFTLDSAWKTLRLLWSSYKQLKDSEIKITQLEREIETRKHEADTRKRRRIEQARDDAEFLWVNRSVSNSTLWQQCRVRWVMHTVNAISDSLGIDRTAAEAKLFDCPAMDRQEDTDHLKAQMENLKVVLDSLNG